MCSFYSLEISFMGDVLQENITTILEVEPNMEHAVWGLEKVIKEDDLYIDYIGYFLDLLEGNYDKLNLLGVTRENIGIWFIYEYEDQCNMEFLPKTMKRLGENGIKLCVSCYQLKSSK